MDTRQIQRGRVRANGTELYYETRGDGAPLLLIAGGLATPASSTRWATPLPDSAR
jgi:hypothetical protein